MSQDSTHGNGGELAELPAYQSMAQELRQLAQLDDTASFEIAARVINEIAQAETIDDVFAANEGGPQSVEDLIGIPIGIIDVRYWQSAEKYAQGTLGVYVVVDYIDGSYNAQMFSTGAPNVVASLRRLQLLNAFEGGKESPFWIKLQSRETARGNLYTIAKADAPPF